MHLEEFQTVNPTPIADTELDVLKLLWEGGPAPVRSLQTELECRGRAWAYTTVQTLLQRLEKKGYVAVDKREVPHVFRAAVSRTELLDQHLAELADKVCDGASTPLVLSLVERSDFSPEELKRFRTLLDQLEQDVSRKKGKRKDGSR